MYAFVLDKSTQGVLVSECSGSRAISSCSRICGSYGRETRSRIMGHCSKWRAAFVCTLGIVDMLPGLADQVPRPPLGMTDTKPSGFCNDDRRLSPLNPVPLLMFGELFPRP